jgi:hypothetical protein
LQILGLIIEVIVAISLQVSGGTEEASPLPMSSGGISEAATTNIIYHEAFEGKEPFSNLKRQFATQYAFELVDSPVYCGRRSGRFELRAGDPMTSNGTRAEVLFGAPDQKERWYSFSAYFPAEAYKKDSNNDIINQWHQKGSPATSLRTRDDKFFLRTGNTKAGRIDIELGSITKDKWHRFVFHFIHSNGRDGLIEVWLNGERVLRCQGGNMYPDKLPRWKVGIYKDDWNGDETTDTDRRVFYIDNIKVGNHLASLQDM